MTAQRKKANKTAEWLRDLAASITAITQPDYYENAAELFSREDATRLRRLATKLAAAVSDRQEKAK